MPQSSLPRHTLFLPGIFGDGPWYNGLRRAIAGGGSTVATQPWGLPKLLFLGNCSDAAVHEKAETELAASIDVQTGELDLVGHSAGCGVILGALAKAHRHVDHVVLIAPSVSPGYDLTPALARAGRIDVFYSERDTLFLKWRCGHFGTYDNIKTPAAGYAGFAGVHSERLVQHAYDPAWRELGNRGGHNSAINETFVRAVVVPLLWSPLPVWPGEV